MNGRKLPSWEGQGVGGIMRVVLVSATHTQPLPGGELSVTRHNIS